MTGPIITLTDTNEFLHALGRDAAKHRVEFGEVMLRLDYQSKVSGLWSATVSIEAMYLRRVDGSEPWDRTVMCLNAYVGMEFGGAFADEARQTEAKASALMARIRTTATALGLDVRAGKIEWIKERSL